ncbi:tagatose-1,6-bisphosphate aldolase [Oceanicola granulosus HTCC2516]|uniref:Tagatose-1,6-bisphosphate aldolase n=1 Tax=Oceanicola granulosus (strain ATCC BAA-861 / DSM 15982 / KCTC 12143 / HTCC2516) TaxID=314256 RepID=Q2CGB5_OCEGH|nr:tagatose-bisphosphate aldolase [Oceanicola granulosus]EAR51803.1 tagatose-1,6-bisphosphate aldolase [Oceanicola granulosus HTCC2516]
MTTAMTTAERRGYQQICGDNGLMMVVAADQRGGMRKVLADTPEAQAAIDEPTLGVVKSAIVRHLANKASCILLDPVCAVPAVVDDGTLARDTGLLVGLDASGWDTDAQGYRISKLVPGITARRVRELGGTGAKLMVYLRPDTPEANDTNIAIIRDCIADFAAEDLLLVVEILTYQLEGESDDAYRAAFPGLIVESARISVDHGAKVLKLPYPGTAEACAEITAICGDIPWAVLSAGVDHETFIGQVETAMDNGASGVIAGRALWKDCISLDAEVRADRLERIASDRLRQIQTVLDRHAAAG